MLPGSASMAGQRPPHHARLFFLSSRDLRTKEVIHPCVSANRLRLPGSIGEVADAKRTPAAERKLHSPDGSRQDSRQATNADAPWLADRMCYPVLSVSPPWVVVWGSCLQATCVHRSRESGWPRRTHFSSFPARRARGRGCSDSCRRSRGGGGWGGVLGV